MIEIDGTIVLPFQLKDKTDFLIIALKEPFWPLCEIVLGKGGFG